MKGSKLPHMPREEFWRTPGATGVVCGHNAELDISIGCLIDLALHDGANTDSAEFFRQRLRFIKQAWEYQQHEQSPR